MGRNAGAYMIIEMETEAGCQSGLRVDEQRRVQTLVADRESTA